MADTGRNARKLTAGIAAVMLTLAAGGTAIAMTLTGNSVDTPAGKFTPTELVDTAVSVVPSGSGTATVETDAAQPTTTTLDADRSDDDYSDDDYSDDDYSDDDTAHRTGDDDHHETDEHHEGADDDD